MIYKDFGYMKQNLVAMLVQGVDKSRTRKFGMPIYCIDWAEKTPKKYNIN